MAKLRFTVTALALLAICSLLIGAGYSIATAAPSTGVTITTPERGQAIVDTGLQIAGNAPSAVLVSISITDTDRDRPDGRVDGSVTSDGDGQWVFVPQAKPAPGHYEVQASYKSGRNRTVDSSVIRFVVVNGSGASAIPATSWQTKVVGGLAFLALLFGIVVYRKHHGHRYPGERPSSTTPRPPTRHERPRRERPLHDRARREQPRREPERREPERGAPSPREPDQEPQPLFMNTTAGLRYQADQAEQIQAMDDEMEAIEHALADTAESLEQSNAAIVALRHHIFDRLTENTPDPAPVPGHEDASTSPIQT